MKDTSNPENPQPEQPTGEGKPKRAPELEFHEWLSDELWRRDLTQSEFAAAIGVNQTTVSAWCRGEAKPTRPNLRRIAVGLDLPVEHVFERANVYDTTPRPVGATRARPPVVLEHELGDWLELGRVLTREQRQRIMEFVESLKRGGQF